MDHIADASPATCRPAPAWLPIGLFVGAPCGAVAGAVLLSSGAPLLGSTPLEGDETSYLFAGAASGLVFGAAIGLLVGVAMTFLGGSHLPMRQARLQAALVASCTTGLILLVLLGGLFAFHPLALATAFIAALAAGGLSHWLASFDMRS